MGRIVNEHKMERLINWRALAPGKKDPPTLVELAKEMGIHYRTIMKWSKQLQVKVVETEVDEFYKHVRDKAMSEKSTAANKGYAELLYKMTKDKEIGFNHGFNAEFIDRIVKSVEARLRVEGTGDLQVQTRYTVLPDEICFYSEQEHGSQN